MTAVDCQARQKNFNDHVFVVPRQERKGPVVLVTLEFSIHLHVQHFAMISARPSDRPLSL